MTPASDRRVAILAALKAAAGAGVSGEALAADLGVSRVAVAKHIAALRDAGYEIEATRGSGYRLIAAPDLPLPEEVSPLLHATPSGSPRWRLVGGVETGSTNDDAKRLARAGEPEGTVVVASKQTAGRGRLGRTWASPQGGLYLSAVLRPPLPPAAVSPLALAIGVGVARGLSRLGASPLLKWPNDVLLAQDDGAAKVAGILLEMSAETDVVEWVVAGCGLNVHRPPAGALAGAGYLDDVLGDRPRLADVAAAVLDGIAEAYDAFLGDGFAALAEEYRSRDALRGREVAVRNATGAVLASGRVDGVDDQGRLLLHNGSERTAVAAGEVTLRP